jgi:hypothetical protein
MNENPYHLARDIRGSSRRALKDIRTNARSSLKSMVRQTCDQLIQEALRRSSDGAQFADPLWIGELSIF